MAFRALINSQVASAFQTVGDLAIDVSFTNGSATDYNFTTDTTTVTNATAVSYKGIPGDTSRKVSDNSIITSVQFRAEQLASVDDYDAATFNGSTWTIVDFVNDGYLTTVNFSRRA